MRRITTVSRTSQLRNMSPVGSPTWNGTVLHLEKQ